MVPKEGAKRGDEPLRQGEGAYGLRDFCLTSFTVAGLEQTHSSY